jgi:hypothetical protein
MPGGRIHWRGYVVLFQLKAKGLGQLPLVQVEALEAVHT